MNRSQSENAYYENSFQFGIDNNSLNICSVYYNKENDDNGDFPSHVHSFYEIRYLKSGYYSQMMDGNYLFVPAGALVVIPPLHIHGVLEGNTPKLLQIHFNQNIFSSIPDARQRIFKLTSTFCIPNPPREMTKVLNRMIQLSPNVTNNETIITKEDFPLSRTLPLTGLLYDLMSMLLDMNFIESDSAIYFTDAPSELPSYQKLLNYILTHPDREMTLKESANYIGMSYYNLSRNFNKVTGMSYIDFINSTKINYAKEQLIKTNDTITKIVSALGFDSMSYFAKLFKGQTGMTPLEYRKSIREMQKKVSM